MTEYDKLYENIIDRPGGPYFRLVTILPKKNGTNAGRAFYEDDDVISDSNGHSRRPGPTKVPRATDIELQLSVHPFKGCPEYEALSYSWGDPTGPEYLLKCNGHRFVALRSLANALLALRLPDRPRTVWIDAICIHQERVQRAIDEKGQQIGMMQHIYRGAARTVVWLGSAREHNFAPAFRSNPFMDDNLRMVDMPKLLEAFVPSLENLLVYVLGTLATAPEELWQPNEEVQLKWSKHRDLIMLAASRVKNDWNRRSPDHPLPPDLQTAIKHKLPSKMPMIPKTLHNATTDWVTRPKNRKVFLESMAMDSYWRLAVENLLAREWWSRKWIIQEVCLAREVVILCGDVSFDFDLLFLSMVLYSTLCDNPTFRGNVLPSWSLIQIMEYRRIYQQKGNSPLPKFLQLLQEFRSSDASDPRDHVYALLGLVAPNELEKLERTGLRPSYNIEMSFARCYTVTARTICATSNNLDALLFVHREAHEPTVVPSWVPDWSSKTKEILLPKDVLGPLDDMNTKPLFSACGPCRSYPTKVREDGVLVVSGYDTDVISEVVGQSMLPLSETWYWKFANGENIPARLLKNNPETMKVLTEMLANHGEYVSSFFEWEEFALSKHRPYPTGEDIHRVFCAVRCFGYMPEGQDSALRAFKEYTEALHSTKRIYDWTLSPSKSSHLLSKTRVPLQKHEPSKIREMLVAIGSVFDAKNMAHMQSFNAMQRFTIGRKLAWTQKGYLALVPDNVRVGDNIVLCKGSKLPLVTRPSKQYKQLELIGACYVHGIARGEAWDGSRCREMEIV
ncbi:heterokaryon incompatibility protein-domain-containing protein [Biscogniauxia mediterranea]|nr:heterokaryon incompatibility protein-domain-containing protein [Biscogniauxia mediterranea]